MTEATVVTDVVVPAAEESYGCGSSTPNEAATSPTSVLRYDELTPFDGFRYGEVDAFGFDIDLPLSLPDIMLSNNNNFAHDEFGEFDVNDFWVDVIC